MICYLDDDDDDDDGFVGNYNNQGGPTK